MSNAKLSNAIKRCYVPLKFQSACLRDFSASPHLQQCIREVVAGKSLLLLGDVGVGKTHLATAALREWCKVKLEDDVFPDVTGTAPRFASASYFLTCVKGSFKSGYTGPSEAEMIECLSRVPLLVLDDLGVTSPSEWVRDVWFQVVNSRYNDELQTVATSNYSLDEMSQRIGRRSVDRLVEMCRAVKLKGKSRRPSAAAGSGGGE